MSIDAVIKRMTKVDAATITTGMSLSQRRAVLKIQYTFARFAIYGSADHGGIRYGALCSQRSHSNAYAVLSPLAATLLMAQTQSIIVTYTGFHAFGT